MKILIKLSIISCLIFLSSAMANSLNINLYAGAAFSKLSNNSTVIPVDGLTKTYHSTEGTQTDPFLGLGAEYAFDHLISKPFTLSLGLSAYYIDLGKISGVETPGSNMGLTDTLNYSMKANSVPILFEPRFIYTAYRFQPYLLTGVGYAFNTLNDFKETTPSGSHAAASNPYDNYTKDSFAYELGGGVQYPFKVKQANLMFRFEYRYLNLGNAQLGAASDQVTNERLASKNTSTNIVNVGLSYLF